MERRSDWRSLRALCFLAHSVGTKLRNENWILVSVHSAKKFIRHGSCARCGACCKTGDPFSSGAGGICRYYIEHGGVGTCTARAMVNPPSNVKCYLNVACYPYPERPRQLDGFELCGFWFEEVE